MLYRHLSIEKIFPKQFIQIFPSLCTIIHFIVHNIVYFTEIIKLMEHFFCHENFSRYKK